MLKKLSKKMAIVLENHSEMAVFSIFIAFDADAYILECKQYVSINPPKQKHLRLSWSQIIKQITKYRFLRV